MWGKKLLTVASIVGLATAANAATLWGKVEVGMTKAQVEALYPSGGDTTYRDNAIHMDHVVITPKCKADGDISFDAANTVEEVRLSGNGSMGGRCADDVLVVLSSKYGQPAATKEKGGGLLARRGKTYVWSRGDGVTMRFKDYSTGGIGGGLLNKSWELRYSAAPESNGL